MLLQLCFPQPPRRTTYQGNDLYDDYQRLSLKENCCIDYDDYSNINKISDYYNDDPNLKINFDYNYFNQLVSIDDHTSNFSIIFSYDDYLRLSEEVISFANAPIYITNIEYFNDSGFEKVIKSKSTTVLSNTIRITNDIDALGRITSNRTRLNNFMKEKVIQYCTDSESNAYTNNFISSVTYVTYENLPDSEDNIPYSRLRTKELYEYDSNGNLIEIKTKLGNVIISTIRYKYDNFSRLIREDNQPLNKTTCFTYDSNGNILTKQVCNFTLSEQIPLRPIIEFYSYNSFLYILG